MAVYDKLTYVLLGLAVLILVTSWLRKRLFQGITLALYGLAIFQLHYTYFGFAAPFLLGRRLVPGAGLPAAAGAQAGGGGRPLDACDGRSRRELESRRAAAPAATSGTRRPPDGLRRPSGGVVGPP